MISDKSNLSSRVGWVLEETEKLLEGARQSFAAYSGNSSDSDALANAQEKARGTLGVLDLLDADGAYMLNREVVLLMDALRQDKVDDWEAACQACADGLTQLSDYLRHLSEGYADLPVILLPVLNNLRATRGAELLSEHLVFLPDEGAITNRQIGTDRYVALDEDKRQEALKRLRHFMQASLLGWFRNEQPEVHLRSARKVTANMLVMNRIMRLRSLWWVTAALLQALEQGSLEHSAAVKVLLGRMEREIRRFREMGEEAYNQAVPDELLKNLLYYVGLADSSEGTLGAVKAAYHLDMYLPKGETLTELRQYYTMPGRELWQAISGSMLDELSLLMSQVESLPGHPNAVQILREVAGKTASMAQTLGMLGLGLASSLTDDLARSQAALADAGDVPDLPMLQRNSEHYLKLETLLREYGETGYDRSEEIFLSDAGSLENSMATREVVRSMLADVRKLQTELTAFHKDSTGFTHLDEASKLLRRLHGTLDVLDCAELEPLTAGSRMFVQDDLLSRHRVPEDREMSCLADILTLLEASLSCMLQSQDHLPLMEMAYDKLRELDGHTKLELLAGIDMAALTELIENKKKARQQIQTGLLHRVRSPLLKAG
ncbi:MAG TPA: hypothetical protein PLB10_10000 [Thiolinea sp.]|nr:hypothetical protein [Thiolinea sp.]